MSKVRQYLKMAVENINSYGDTDIFPFPAESLFFKDEQVLVVNILDKLHKNFDAYFKEHPLIHERGLQAVGYFGFRWGTQIDPLWNAYFLALVLSIADDVELARLAIDKNYVFSYRYSYDKENKTIFSKDYNWREFNKKCIEKVKSKKYVLKCDISDFYPRIYHHRVENALKKASKNTESIRRIKKILSILSKGVSYGLPVGGPAARILSELLLNRVDRLLVMEGLDFCRYADDYLIFTDTIEQAYKNLIFLCEKLHENEGLALQKSKTQIMSSEEYLATSVISEDPENPGQNEQESNFLKLRLSYDPYSPTAVEDYKGLKQELLKFDIVGMLGRQIQKSRIDQALTRRLINSVKYISEDKQKLALMSLYENLEILYPVFPSVIMLTRALIDGFDENQKETVFSSLRGLFQEDSYITQVPVNLSFAIRILANDKSEEADIILGNIFKSEDNPVIRADIILAMAQKNTDYWISDRIKHYPSMSGWEKRASLLASFILGDEGEHWRNKICSELGEYEKAVVTWFSSRYSRIGWGTLL